MFARGNMEIRKDVETVQNMENKFWVFTTIHSVTCENDTWTIILDTERIDSYINGLS